MTDHDDELDELASAYLDGRAEPAERAQVAADPALLARVEQLRRVRTMVASHDPEPVDEARREMAIAAARRAVGPTGVVTSMAARRRARPARRTVALVGAAAAVALVALAVPLLDRLSSDSSDPTRSEEAATALDAPHDDAVAGSTDAASPNQEAGSPLADLGAFGDLDGLTTAVRVAVDHDGSGPAPSTTSALSSGSAAVVGPDPCATDTPRAGPIYRASAELGGRAVVVLVMAGEGDTRELVVLAASGCQVVARRAL